MSSENPLIVFITGVSGAGKTTLCRLLIDNAAPGVRVHDLDDIGVPPDADRDWRIAATGHWLGRAKQYQHEGISTVITGSTSPAEVAALLSSFELDPALFIFLELTPDEIRRRLADRGWPEKLVEANLNWSGYLKREAMAQPLNTVLDVTGRTPENVLEEVLAIIAVFSRPGG